MCFFGDGRAPLPRRSFVRPSSRVVRMEPDPLRPPPVGVGGVRRGRRVVGFRSSSKNHSPAKNGTFARPPKVSFRGALTIAVRPSIVAFVGRCGPILLLNPYARIPEL